MASPNSSWTEIITTTLENRSGKTADNVSKTNALLATLKEQGAWKAATGRSIVQELEYAEGNFQWYSGYEQLTITPPDVLTAAEYNWKQAAAGVSISGLEKDVQNTGRQQIIDLMEARIKNAERTMKNNVNVGMYSDGTGSGGKQIGGLQLLVADDPTASATIGGINQNTYTWWRNQIYDLSVESVTIGSTTIQGAMNGALLRATRGNDKPNLILLDSVYYNYFWSSMQAIQRVTNTDKATAGFASLAYAGNVPVVYEDSNAMPASHGYFLNTDYLEFRYAADRLFKPSSTVRPANQDAETVLILFAGNLTCSNRSLQCVMHA